MFRYYEDPLMRSSRLLDEEAYQAALAWHEQHACCHIPDDALIFDAICLSHLPLKKTSLAEYHPAIQRLCDFWRYFKPGAGEHNAAVPIIQLFLGNKRYVPLINTIAPLDDATAHLTSHREASVIFDTHFLVTYLASRHVAEASGCAHEWIHYTVFESPYFVEFNPDAKQANRLAWHTLQGLRHFPVNFPQLWRELQQRYGGKAYEIH